MNQLVEIAWEDVRLPFNQWNSLDQLWLYITRNSHEFATSHCYGESRTAKWLQFTALSETRYPIAGVLQAGSALADRPVVARPNQPLQLPSGEKVTLFVGIPLWFNLKRGEDILLDTPFALLSDTWFGPDTRNGEVCYACPTHARLSMEGVARSAFKAITPVEIHNEDGAPLLIDKVNLPIPNLSLYRDAQRHWTSQVTITRSSTLTGGEVQISSGPPRYAKSPILLNQPRRRLEGGMLHKAMSLLLG